MIVILCTVSDTDYNDSVLDGLVHFSLTANIKGTDYCYAVFHSSPKRMEIIKPDKSKEPLLAKPKSGYSMRYCCVYWLLSHMRSDDQLMAVSLSDLADTAAEAVELYFAFLDKGIQMSFFDASYLDTKTLQLNSSPSSDQKILIERIIKNYFSSEQLKPCISNTDLSTLAAMPAAKKKSPD